MKSYEDKVCAPTEELEIRHSVPQMCVPWWWGKQHCDHHFWEACRKNDLLLGVLVQFGLFILGFG